MRLSVTIIWLNSLISKYLIFRHQTWEDPTVTDTHTGQKGDGDPIDVVEIGYKVLCTRTVLIDVATNLRSIYFYCSL